MYISTEINSFAKLGDNRKIIKLLKDVGFTAYDYSMFYGSLADEVLYAENYIERAKAFRAYADGIGLPCNQAHAPFPTARKGDEEYNKKAFADICRAIEVSGILGAKVCVVHPCNDYTAEENAELYKRFEPIARKAGVKIGLENMWNWKSGAMHACAAACSQHDDFRKHLELLPSDVFVACLDIGHAEMAGLDTDAVRMIKTLNERLEAIHLHDNDCIHDNHALPYSLHIDFEAVIAAMKEIGYMGDITLESDTYVRKFPLELYPQAASFMAAVANDFKEKISKNK